MKYLIGLIFLFVLASCEGYIGGSGTVINTKGEPLENVQAVLSIENKDGLNTDTVYTNAVGEFNVTRLVGCVTGCPNFKVQFSKIGYREKIMELEQAENNRIVLIEN